MKKYNEFAEMMFDNHQTMAQLDAEEMTRNEWKNYLKISDAIATTAWAYIDGGEFEPFRSSVHALFSFLEYETKFLAIDSYTIRFIPKVIPYKVIRSKEYKEAEKAARTFKHAIEWACIESGLDEATPESVVFPKVTSMADYESLHFHKDTQDYYNAIVPIVKQSLQDGHDIQVKHLNTRLEALEAIKEELAKQKGNYYKDLKNPMKSAQGKDLKHAPMSIRKGIEDTVVDIIQARDLMTPEQIAKEEAQIKGGKKEIKRIQAREEAESK